MQDEFPKIYKSKVDHIRSKVQKEFYVRTGEGVEQVRRPNKPTQRVDKMTLLKKINSIFERPDYVYQADIIIVYKNGENIAEKVVGIKDNSLITIDNARISIDDIADIK